jgi:hypothetical protein
MLEPKDLLAHRERPLVGGLGIGVPALGRIQQAQDIERKRYVAMFGTALFRDSYCPFGNWCSFRMLA